MTRFVLISQGRTAATLLLNNFAAHPQITCHGNPFAVDPADRDVVEGQKWEPGSSSADFARQRLWAGKTQIEGFRLYPFQCREDDVSADLWDLLRGDGQVKFIFLNRRNLLMKHLSELRAAASGVRLPTGEDYLTRQYGNQIAFQVALPMLRRELFETYAGFNRLAEIFSRHDSLYLSYEDLEINAAGCMAEILKFLGAAPQALVEGFKPGTLTAQTTRVINPVGVRRFLTRSVWADYLDTCPLV